MKFAAIHFAVSGFVDSANTALNQVLVAQV